MTSWPCAQFPEYMRLLEDDYLKSSLLRETQGGEAFIERAAPVICRIVLGAIPYRGPSHEFRRKLREMGCDDDTLSRALARAWLEESDHFMLPRERRRDRIRSTKWYLAVSVMTALLAIVGAIFYARRAYPDVVATLLFLEPLLAMGGIAIAALVFWVLNKIFGRHK